MAKPKKILFVCTGNICRSPMAEGLFRKMTEGRRDISASSAGVSTMGGQAPSAHAISVLKEIGVDISRQRSRPLSEQDVAEASHIFVMTRGHFDAVAMVFPEAAEKIYLLREFDDVPGDIPDPIGMDRAAYAQTRDAIAASLKNVLRFLDQPDPMPHLAEPPTQAATAATAATTATARIAIATDHGGVALKVALGEHLTSRGHTLADYGSDSTSSVDYPDYAAPVCRDILGGRADFGILLCKSGIGMSIAANRYPGIRAALVASVQGAITTRHHNDANVLCLPAENVNASEAAAIADAFLSTPFEGGRHCRRVEKIDEVPAAGADLAKADPQIAAAIAAEARRQAENIELIASENFASRAVREAQGSCLTNKYAEGYPGKRWYGGCEHVDVIEQLAIDRLKALFPGAEHANVQPHSGSQANAAVYFSVLQPGDRILTMDLAHGGHLTHGHKANFSGRFYQVTHYGVSEKDERIDYDALERLALEVRPKMITAGASAYPRIIDFARMRAIADKAGAYLFVDMAHIAGLVAGGVHPSPVGLADFTTSTTHKSLRGPRGGIILCKAQYAKAIDGQVFPGVQGGPLEHVIAAKAVCFREALEPAFKTYARQVARNAAVLAEAIAARGYRIVSGGTDNHVMLVDLRPRGLHGKLAQETLDRAGITVNKNGIPFDTEPISKGGGIRIGTPAVTTRGMKEPEMAEIATLIADALDAREDASALEVIRARVRALTARFPIP